jgi:hypothetical protein
VCGGIPIIHSLHSDFLADRITKIRGIMNGTVRGERRREEEEGRGEEKGVEEKRGRVE